MIDRQGAVHHVAHDNLPLAHHWPLFARADGEDHRLRRVDDGGKVLDPEHAQVGDREAATLELFELQLADLGACGEILHLGRNLRQALHVGIAHDGRDQATVGGHGDRDVDGAVLNHLVLGPRGIALGMIAQRLGAGLDHHVVDRDLGALLLGDGVDRLTRRQQRVDFQFDR